MRVLLVRVKSADAKEGIAACAREFILFDKKMFAENSSRYYDNHYTKTKFISKLMDIFEKVRRY